MQAKKYQQRVLDALDTYLTTLDETGDIAAAFEIAQDTGDSALPKPYQNTIPGVPQLTYKVPTGGGKTYLACASLSKIIDHLPPGRPRVVVWLVPREAILTQTLSALRDENHPYRQRINRDFQGRVEVYSKEELLTGQNFTMGAIAGQLSIMILTFDSFRRAGEGLRAYEENGALISFTSSNSEPVKPVPYAHPTSLFQVINNLNPVVIVDESHRATTALSHAMLTNFNPAFTLSLTATPSESANILVYVRATELKAEQMVKLPVLVVNRGSQTEVIADTIDLRAALEAKAAQAHSNGAPYCRPIALIQAEPRGQEDATTFEKLRDKLTESGVPRNHIAIKTATVDELRNVDLVSPTCEVRYIITVNALAEGWDCPFAYILAALANKHSAVSVEQIVGRVLRQPNARRFPDKTLNMSYVITASNKFDAVVTRVVAGLNNAGFTRDDVRIDDYTGPDPTVVRPEVLDFDVVTPDSHSSTPDDDHAEDVADFDAEQVACETGHVTDPLAPNPTPRGGLTNILDDAHAAADEYDAYVEGEESEGRAAYEQTSGAISSIPTSGGSTTSTSGTTRTPAQRFRFMMRPQFIEDASSVRLPQFVQEDEASFLTEARPLLEPSSLAANIRLRGRDTRLSLGNDSASVRTVDVDDHNVPIWRMADPRLQDLVVEYMHGIPDDARIEALTSTFVRALDRSFDDLPSRELRAYVKRVIEDMDGDERLMLETHPAQVSEALKNKIKFLVVEHAKQEFGVRQATGQITVDLTYQLPAGYNFRHAHEFIDRSLYEGEDAMNNLESKLATHMSSMGNVRWWHRNPSRQGFRINGFINHYPDFIVHTTKNRVVVIETKSDHLNANDSLDRLAVGNAWASAAGRGYDYFMVFDDSHTPVDGSHRITEFLGLLNRI